MGVAAQQSQRAASQPSRPRAAFCRAVRARAALVVELALFIRMLQGCILRAFGFEARTPCLWWVGWAGGGEGSNRDRPGQLKGI